MFTTIALQRRICRRKIVLRQRGLDVIDYVGVAGRAQQEDDCNRAKPHVVNDDGKSKKSPAGRQSRFSFPMKF